MIVDTCRKNREKIVCILTNCANRIRSWFIPTFYFLIFLFISFCFVFFFKQRYKVAIVWSTALLASLGHEMSLIKFPERWLNGRNSFPRVLNNPFRAWFEINIKAYYSIKIIYLYPFQEYKFLQPMASLKSDLHQEAQPWRLSLGGSQLFESTPGLLLVVCYLHPCYTSLCRRKFRLDPGSKQWQPPVHHRVKSTGTGHVGSDIHSCDRSEIIEELHEEK